MEDSLTEDKIIQIVQTYLKTSAFTDRKLTDTPTDANQVVPRKYITNNGPSTARPTTSVIGQPYLDTTLASGRGKPIWYGPSGWVDATGTLV